MTMDNGITLQPYMKCSGESNEVFTKLVCQNIAMQMKEIKENVTKQKKTPHAHSFKVLAYNDGNFAQNYM